MRVSLSFLAVLAALVVPAAAHAATYDTFTVTGNGLDLTFTVPANPTPAFSTAKTDFALGSLTFTLDGTVMTADDVYFFTKPYSGGFEITDASGNTIDDLNFFGVKLFTGGVKDPVFKTGDFALTGGPACTIVKEVPGGSCTYSLSIDPVAPTPEPSSLALLGTGLLGAVGVVRRRFNV